VQFSYVTEKRKNLSKEAFRGERELGISCLCKRKYDL